VNPGRVLLASHARVLLAGHDRALLRVLAVNLRARGHRVDLATSAVSALARAGHGPDLIILDLGMPDQDGGR
jgi:two-component system, OmpR family, KDP operon response regulator KdpE